MAPKQRMRIANEKASKNILIRGNVPKSSVSKVFIEVSYNLSKFNCWNPVVAFEMKENIHL